MHTCTRTREEDDDDGRRRQGYDANENMRRVALPLPSPLLDAHAGNNETSAKEKVFVPATIASDVELRRKVIAVFNKRRQDFPSDSAHNDYLEFVEDVCFKLIEGIDVAETEKIVAKEKENARKNKARRERNEEEDKVTCPEKFGFIFGGERVYRRSQSKGGRGRRCVADDDDDYQPREHESEER